MNAALQSLSHTPCLTQFFLTNLFIREINKDNPLGMEGKVALAYGKLLKQLWNTAPFSRVAPRNMKWTISKFEPRFDGYQQHDASELLFFVLDGLHEGLNRILKKPYTEYPDSNNRDDAIVAKEYCAAQLKSTLQWDCGRKSVKFDEYNVLSLPCHVRNVDQSRLL